MKRTVTSRKRLNHEPPAVTSKLGWRYHHIGIPHTQPRAREHHVAHLGVYVCGFETSPYGIEWIRFEPHCDVPEIVRIVPHIAFAVDDLDEALKGREILIAPTEPSAGVRVGGPLNDSARGQTARGVSNSHKRHYAASRDDLGFFGSVHIWPHALQR